MRPALRHGPRPPRRLTGGRRLRARGIGEAINWRELAALVVALAGLATALWWFTRPPGPVPMPVPAQVRTLKQPLDVFLAVDSSGSMLLQNDKHNTRLTDAEALVRWMRRYIARRGDKLHVAEFARTLEPRVDRSLGALGGAGVLGTAPDGYKTYFGPIAQWVGDRSIPGHVNTVLIVTDAVVPDGDSVLRRLRSFARRVVVIQIAHKKGGTVDTPGIQVINATTDRPQAVAAAAARVLLHVTGQGVKP